jgi:ribonucleoside-diphosphate reductase alpha chain
VPELYEAWGTEKFDELYEIAERKTSVDKKKINAQELIFDMLKERAETGRIYIMNIDHCNTHSSFKDRVYMSNLCQEITLPTDPIQHIDGEGEIALCILSAINVGKINHVEELEPLCELAVRSLDEIIDHQKYPVRAAEISTKARRSLGIGYIGLAHYLAKNKVAYGDKQALKLVDELTEAFQYYLLAASCDLAEEKGPCEYFNRTKYSDGILPIDTYKKEVDELVKPNFKYDWEALRKDIAKHGLRHSTLTAQMPSESSSVVSNATNGIEPPRDYLSIKKSKKGTLKQVVPQYQQLKNFYTLLWDMKGNEGYINIVAVMQKYFDQAISGNWSYNPENYEDNQVPVSVMAQDLLNTYKYGWKTSYYQNTYDAKKDIDEPSHPVGWKDNVEEQEQTITAAPQDEEACDSCTI